MLISAERIRSSSSYSSATSGSDPLPAGGEMAALQVGQAAGPALQFKVAALVVILSVTLLFGFVPVCIVRGAGSCCGENGARRRPLLSMVSCFGGGVFVGTCLLGLLPDYLQGVDEAFSNAGITFQFPLPEFIMAMGFFLVLVLEQLVLAFKDQSELSPQTEEHRALLVNSDGGHAHLELGLSSALRTLILVLSLSLHSVFEGLAVGLLEDERQVLEMSLALTLHKSIISFSLAFKLLQGQLRRPLVAGCLLLFAAMSPLGIVVGIGVADSKASPQHQLARSILEGVATGTFIYITFLEILPHELHSGRHRLPKLAALLAGFAVVTGVFFIKL